MADSNAQRRHTRINLDIWGDDAWLDLTADAQLLYLSLYTSPGRTYCGAHEWHVGKLCQRATDWTPERVLAAAEVLSERLFLIIDETTGECLLRSWIKHDGLWRTPNMAVTMANARAGLASRALRGVVVHEVAKLKKLEPTSTSWDRDAVKELLSQKAVNPSSLPPFKGGGNPGPNGGLNPTANPYGQNAVNPPPNPAPTTATATSLLTTSTKGGYVSTESHQRPQCPHHPLENSREACDDCRRRREWDEAQTAALDELKRQRRKVVDDCDDCDDFGRRDDLSLCTKHPSLKDPLEEAS